MKKAKLLSLLLALAMLLSLAACGAAPAETPAATEAPTEAPVEATEAPAESAEITVTDLIGREITVKPGSYQRVVCIGAGALRLYSYIGDVSLLCGVEDIDNETLSERPKMFDSVARPYVLAHSDMFASLPSCGVGGPNAQSPEAEKILTCEPDIVISLYGDADKANALQEQLGVPVVTLMSGPDSVFDERFNESVRLLGTIFEESEKAETLIGFIAAERAGIEARTADIAEEDKPAVYICGLGNWGTTNRRYKQRACPLRRYRRRGQARCLYLRSRQLGHDEPPDDRAGLCFLPRGEREERCLRPWSARRAADRGGEIRRARRGHGRHDL